MDQDCSEQTGCKVLAWEAGSGPEKEWISEIDPLRTLQLLSTLLAGGYSEMLQIERRQEWFLQSELQASRSFDALSKESVVPGNAAVVSWV